MLNNVKLITIQILWSAM